MPSGRVASKARVLPQITFLPDQCPRGEDRPSAHQGRKTSLPGDPPAEGGGCGYSHLPSPDVTKVADAFQLSGISMAQWSLQAQVTLSGHLCFSAEVKMVGLEGSDKLTILRGCPGLPGAPGPKGEAGTNGKRGRCRHGWGHWLLLFLKPDAELGNTPTVVPRSRAGSGPCKSQEKN